MLLTNGKLMLVRNYAVTCDVIKCKNCTKCNDLNINCMCIPHVHATNITAMTYKLIDLNC